MVRGKTSFQLKALHKGFQKQLHIKYAHVFINGLGYVLVMHVYK